VFLRQPLQDKLGHFSKLAERQKKSRQDTCEFSWEEELSAIGLLSWGIGLRMGGRPTLPLRISLKPFF